MKEARCLHTKSISWVCSLGLFLAGYIFYTSSLIEPFYASLFQLTSWQIGLAQSAVPIGAMIGAVLAGSLADHFGRHRLLVWNFLLLAITGLIGSLSFDFNSLFATRVLNGFLAGTLYPLCATYLTEMTPQSSLARQSAILMFVNCLAAPIGCIIAIILSYLSLEQLLWRLLIVCHSIPALIAFVWIKKLPESREWLTCEKKSHLVIENKSLSKNYFLNGYKMLFNPVYRNITFCLMGTWFLMDVAYYGINFFVPYLLQAMQIQSTAISVKPHSLLSDSTIWGTFIINIFFTTGAFIAVLIIEKFNLVKLQQYGFLLASLSLFLLAGYFYMNLNQFYMIVLLFVLFNFALNAGPDVTTYLLPATSYPVEIRASGHGMIAGFAKFGSVLGVLFLPKLQDLWGYEIVIITLSALLFTAYLLTIGLGKVVLKDRDVTEANIIYETN